MNFSNRLATLRRTWRESCPDADAFLISNPVNVRYLTGFTGDSTFLLITSEDSLLLSDGRYETQLQQQCPEIPVRLRGPEKKLLQLVQETLAGAGYSRVSFEAASLSFGFVSELAAASGTPQLEPAPQLVEALREIKDDDEVALIRRSIEITQSAFRVVRSAPLGSLSECQFAHALEEQIRRFGGEGCSFAPIVAAGPAAALPHYQPGNDPVTAAAVLLVDWGSVFQGYASDLTRMIWTGPIDREVERVYHVVREAQQAAIAAIRPGVQRCEIDRQARDVIEAAGYGEAFQHGVGHGIGLEIHESPRMAGGEEATLAAGMVVTVEPGIYLPGRFGVRLEDDILVTADGYENLSADAPGLDDPAWLR